MELIQEFTKEITIGAIFLALIVSTIKGFFSKLAKLIWEQIRILCQHLKKKQRLYYVAIGSVATLCIIYSIFTVKTQINTIQVKFDKYENLKKVVNDGRIIIDYEKLIKNLEDDSINDFRKLELSKNVINFPSKEENWKDTHLTNIFGIISVDRKNNQVYFEYKSVVGKNRYSDTIYHTEDYIKDNPKLFATNLILQGKDKEAFLNNSASKCLNRPLQKDLKKMELELKENNYKYEVCDFLQTFFYTTGRIKGHEQKTFNEINYIYYISTPYASEGESSLYFYYAFNSDKNIIFDTKVHSILQDFLDNVNRYKTMKNLYDENNIKAN
jgi:hypothetical protein